MPLYQKELSRLPPGKYPDDGSGGVRGLFLWVKPNGGRSWVIRLTVGGKRKELGLGGLRDTPLSIAREKAIEIRQRRSAGKPLRETQNGARASLEAIYEEVLSQRKHSWASSRSEAQWRSSLKQHCGSLRAREIGSITSADIVDVLNPIWHSKQETAKRILSRLNITILYARAKGLYWRPENPVELARASLPKIKRERKNMSSVQVDRAPHVFCQIMALDSPSAWALAFAILTAARSGEVRKMTMDQLDFENAIWKVPAEFMKTGKPHSVPLPPLAISLARKGISLNRKVVFPNRSGVELSDAALLECLKGVMHGVTVHGWRSTFTDWAAEQGFASILSDKALSHQETDKVRRAYQRSNLVEARRPLMERWEEYLTSSPIW